MNGVVRQIANHVAGYDLTPLRRSWVSLVVATMTTPKKARKIHG
jgi:hypothetical protein